MPYPFGLSSDALCAHERLREKRRPKALHRLWENYLLVAVAYSAVFANDVRKGDNEGQRERANQGLYGAKEAPWPGDSTRTLLDKKRTTSDVARALSPIVISPLSLSRRNFRKIKKLGVFRRTELSTKSKDFALLLSLPLSLFFRSSFFSFRRGAKKKKKERNNHFIRPCGAVKEFRHFKGGVQRFC